MGNIMLPFVFQKNTLAAAALWYKKPFARRLI